MTAAEAACSDAPDTGNAKAKAKKEVMRKHMTRAYDELLTNTKDCVYLGEDVRHGGYYLVTDGLFRKHPMRVHDFPPCETSLLGAAMGFSQAGLTPIVEIPYAKYLDCGADVFFEIVLNHWVTNGAQPAGMVVRLQGFGKGVFGGNFHTHNALHLPPGLDVVCYSNGRDYVRGLRHAVHQARSGRVVMLVDSTNLLNQRHLDAEMRDGKWTRAYPDSGMLSYDSVIMYEDGDDFAGRTISPGTHRRLPNPTLSLSRTVTVCLPPFLPAASSRRVNLPRVQWPSSTARC